MDVYMKQEILNVMTVLLALWMLAVLTLTLKMDALMKPWILNAMMDSLALLTLVFLVMKMQMKMVASTLLKIVYVMILLIALITSAPLMLTTLMMQDAFTNLLMKAVTMVSCVPLTLVVQTDALMILTTVFVMME